MTVNQFLIFTLYFMYIRTKSKITRKIFLIDTTDMAGWYFANNDVEQ